MKTINEKKTNEVLAAVNNLLGVDEVQAMRNNLREMMDCYFLNDNSDHAGAYAAFKGFDNLLADLEPLAG
jgi:hypothetical protein